MKQEKLSGLIKRSKSMWWADGIPEFVTGVVLLVFALMQYLMSLPCSKPCTTALVFGQIGVIFAGPFIIKALKRKYTEPVLGYFRPLERKNGTARWLILFVFLAVFAVAFLVSTWWIAVSAGALIVLVPTGVIYSVKRLVAEGIISALVPPVVVSLCNGNLCIPFSLALIGVIMASFGVVALKKFKVEYIENDENER